MGVSRLMIEELLELNETIASSIFKGLTYAWEILPRIHDYIIELGPTLSESEYRKVADDVWISRTAIVAPTASITGPAIIDHNAEVRHCAFIRGNAIVGESAIIGNSTEIKNILLFNKVQVPHFNYVGDSVLGFKAHMGAGCITSNVKSDKMPVTVTIEGERIETKLRKFGAILGDNVEVGSNTVLNPGSVIGRNVNIYPLSMVREFIPQNSIYKKRGEVVKKR